MLLFAFGQPEFNFGKAPLGKIDAERDEREPLLLRLAEKLIDLLAVEKQLPGAERLVIHDVTVTVGADVAVVEKDLTLPYAGVTILQVYAPISQGLDLRALEHDAGFELLFNEIVMVGLAVRDHGFFETVLFFPHQTSGFHISMDVHNVQLRTKATLVPRTQRGKPW